MKIPCDNCKINDICGLVGSRKRAANKVDLILKEVNDGFIEIPVICTRQEIRDAEEDSIVSSGEGTNGDLPRVLQVPGLDGDSGGTGDEHLPKVSSGTPSDAGAGGETGNVGVNEKFVKAAWEYCKEEDDDRLSRLIQSAFDRVNGIVEVEDE